MDVREVQAALNKLRPEQREALLLVGVWELSYEEAAEICRCAVGTMKSRVNRARGRLAEFLSGTPGRPHDRQAGTLAATREKFQKVLK